MKNLLWISLWISSSAVAVETTSPDNETIYRYNSGGSVTYTNIPKILLRKGVDRGVDHRPAEIKSLCHQVAANALVYFGLIEKYGTTNKYIIEKLKSRDKAGTGIVMTATLKGLEKSHPVTVYSTTYEHCVDRMFRKIYDTSN